MIGVIDSPYTNVKIAHDKKSGRQEFSIYKLECVFLLEDALYFMNWNIGLIW